MYKLNIRHYRLKHHLSQKQLGKLIGVDQSYIAKLESPNRVESPTLRVMEKLSDLFNVELIELVEKNTLVCIIVVSGISYLKIISNT